MGIHSAYDKGSLGVVQTKMEQNRVAVMAPVWLGVTKGAGEKRQDVPVVFLEECRVTLTDRTVCWSLSEYMRTVEPVEE